MSRNKKFNKFYIDALEKDSVMKESIKKNESFDIDYIIKIISILILVIGLIILVWMQHKGIIIL